MKALKIIEINDEGLFRKSPERIMYVSFNDTILFTFIGKKYPHSTPFILTNFGNKERRKFQISVSEAANLSIEQMYSQYNFIEGNYEFNLNWSCEVLFNHSGMYFFQLIFVDNKLNDENSVRAIKVTEHFEYLIVNPTYDTLYFHNINKLKSMNASIAQIDIVSDKELREHKACNSIDDFRIGKESETRDRNWRLNHSEGKKSRLNGREVTENKTNNNESQVEVNNVECLTVSKNSLSDNTRQNESRIEHFDCSSSSNLNAKMRVPLNFDAMSIITLHPTMMGPIEEWEEELEYLIERGYTGFHFSPIQKLGESGSVYSIVDPLQLNSNIFVSPKDSENSMSSQNDDKTDIPINLNGLPIININEDKSSSMVESSGDSMNSNISKQSLDSRNKEIRTANESDRINNEVIETTNAEMSIKTDSTAAIKVPTTNSVANKSTNCHNDSRETKILMKSTNKDSYDKLVRIFYNLKLRYSVFFTVDIIWNYCSVNSDWILRESQCYHSPGPNSSLNAAFELDNLLHEYSIAMMPTVIDSVSDVDNLVEKFKVEWLMKAKFEEYFQIDVEQVLSPIMHCFESQSAESKSEFAIVDPIEVGWIRHHVTNFGNKRFGLAIEHNWLVNFLKSKREKRCFQEVVKMLKQVNLMCLQRANEWIAEMIVNLREELIERYVRKKESSEEGARPLFTRYFDALENGSWALLNGHLKSNQTTEDSTLETLQLYFRRCISVWEDSIKLNYQTPNECPMLWHRMNEYTQQMARIFDGFRLNNFHSTSIEAAKHFIDAAMKRNESLFLFSEVYVGAPKADVTFCLKVGVHRLIKELQRCESLNDLLETVQEHLADSDNYAGQIPALAQNNHEIVYLKAMRPLPILCDQVYNNPSYFQRHAIHVQLPILAIENFVTLMVGSVRGFDELFSHQIPNNSTKRYPRLPNLIATVEDLIRVWFIFKRDERAETVELFGSFNDWKESTTLQRVDSSNVFSTCLKLRAGTYQYKYRVNGEEWAVFPMNESETNDEGYTNNVIRVHGTTWVHSNLVC